MRGERGQVTLFVIVGIVLLLVVGLIFLILRNSASTVSPGRSGADTAILSSFLGSCIDTVAHEELVRAGFQGGLLSLEGYPTADVTTTNSRARMTYGITRNDDHPASESKSPWVHDAPRYPEWNVTVEHADLDGIGRKFAPHQDGYFGDVTLPAVCDTAGPNRPGSTFTCRYYIGNPPGTHGPSTQSALTERILQGIRGCANLRAFEEALGQTVERVGDPNVTIQFTLASVIVGLEYPVLVAGETRLERFQRDYPVRYLPIAQFAHDLAREETRNATFNVSRDYPHLPSFRPGFSVNANRAAAIENPEGVATQRATLVTILDAQSVLEGQSYAFSFLIEHRAPMLSHVLSIQDGEAVNSLGLNSFAQFVAADPDEQPFAITRDRDDFGNLLRVTITDADGEEDWQEY